VLQESYKSVKRVLQECYKSVTNKSYHSGLQQLMMFAQVSLAIYDGVMMVLRRCYDGVMMML
jgi:hypothetical protein